jgi:hypothetical protein
VAAFEALSQIDPDIIPHAVKLLVQGMKDSAPEIQHAALKCLVALLKGGPAWQDDIMDPIIGYLKLPLQRSETFICEASYICALAAPLFILRNKEEEGDVSTVQTVFNTWLPLADCWLKAESMVHMTRVLVTSSLKEALLELLAPQWQGLQEVDGIMAPLSLQQGLVGGLLLALDDCRAATEVLTALLECNRRFYALTIGDEDDKADRAESNRDQLCANFKDLHRGVIRLHEDVLEMIMEELALPSGVPDDLLKMFTENIQDKTQILAMCRAIRKVDVSRVEVQQDLLGYHSDAILLLGNKTILECVGDDESLENMRFLVAIYSQDGQTLISAENAFQNAGRSAVDAGAVDAMLDKFRAADIKGSLNTMNAILKALVQISANGCRDEVVESLKGIVADATITERTRTKVQKRLEKIR